ncbi:MAG TPA: diacylglycerol kinase family protein [Terriglobales bacterium]|nr:diacylglycerol kinase family protein [Terriglobales bacterium]
MRDALILYNPYSGRRKRRREADIRSVQTVFENSGVKINTSLTGDADHAGERARQAAASGCDAVIACGGDGTINAVLQGLVGTKTALGVIPLGTANALAHDLRIPMHPVKAARSLLDAEAKRYAVGQVNFQDRSGRSSSRYFTVAVGIGADAHLFYKLDQTLKTNWGMAAYYAKATHVWFTHPLERFETEFRLQNGEFCTAGVSEVLAVRISHFGGVLRAFAPGASLSRNDMRLVLFKTRSRLRYLQYILRAALGHGWSVPGIELFSAERARCRLAQNSPKRRIYVEVDGELAGTLPAELSMVPDALTMLVPRI